MITFPPLLSILQNMYIKILTNILTKQQNLNLNFANIQIHNKVNEIYKHYRKT